MVIPKNIREKYNITPGQKFHMIPYKGRIELIPLASLKKMRGFLKGMDTEIEREKDRL